MTRARGKIIVASPCCKTLYSRPNYTSINMMASEFWTDGKDVNSLAPGDWGLRRCVCGNYFNIYFCETLYKIPELKPPAPDDWQVQNWWTKLNGKPSKEHYERFYDTRPSAEREKDLVSIAQDEIFVSDAELAKVIESKPKNRNVEIIARRRYWQYLNDPYRELYRKYKLKDPNGFPAYEITDEVRNNISNLINILKNEEDLDLLELAELYRQLGDFDNAKKTLLQVNRNHDDDDPKFIVVGKLIDQQRQGPAWYARM
jgi:hypothetical protein